MENFIVINTEKTVPIAWENAVTILIIVGFSLAFLSLLLVFWDKTPLFVTGIVLFSVGFLTVFSALPTTLAAPKITELIVSLKEGVTIEQVAKDYEIVDGNGIIFTIREKGE